MDSIKIRFRVYFFAVIGDGCYCYGVGSFVVVLTNATEMMIVKRESRQHQKKINMVIGVFFSEVGTQLLSFFCDCDKDIDEIRNDLIVKDNWNEIRFKQIHEIITGHNFNMDVTSEDLVDIRQFLMGKRAFARCSGIIYGICNGK